MESESLYAAVTEGRISRPEPLLHALTADEDWWLVEDVPDYLARFDDHPLADREAGWIFRNDAEPWIIFYHFDDAHVRTYPAPAANYDTCPVRSGIVLTQRYDRDGLTENEWLLHVELEQYGFSQHISEEDAAQRQIRFENTDGSGRECRIALRPDHIDLSIEDGYDASVPTLDEYDALSAADVFIGHPTPQAQQEDT